MLDGERHEVAFCKLEDLARHKRLFVDSNRDIEAYYALPRLVKRWALPQSKPTNSTEEMKVIAINGNPRKEDNILVSWFSAEEVHFG